MVWRQYSNSGEVRAISSCAASSVTGVSDTGATFPKGEGTGERLLAFLHLFAKAFPASGKVSLAVRPMTDEPPKGEGG